MSTERDLAAEEKLIELAAECKNDPLRFVRLAFPWGEGELAGYEGPHEWQVECMEHIGEQLEAGGELGAVIRYAVSSGHGVGKSALMAWLILWAMTTFPDTRGVITANSEPQLKGKTWPELGKWQRLSMWAHWFRWTPTSLHSKDKAHERTWRFDQVNWSVHSPESFAGLHNAGKRLLVLMDEASAIDDMIWEVTEGALTDERTQILWVAFGNPTRSTGRFRECWRNHRHRWETQQVDSRKVPGTNKEQIQEWLDDHGEDSDFVKVRVRGVFPSKSARQFISEVDADAGYGKRIKTTDIEWAPLVLSCETAWTGDDELIIGCRQGLVFRVLEAVMDNDNHVNIAQKLARYEDELEADAVFIDFGGGGDGVFSVGSTWGREWQLVYFAGESANPQALNKRAEMWASMKAWLKAGGGYEADELMRQQLMAVETVERLDGKLQLEAKKDMRRRLGPAASPDRADALALTFAYPVHERKRIDERHQPVAESGYQPPFARS